MTAWPAAGPGSVQEIVTFCDSDAAGSTSVGWLPQLTQKMARPVVRRRNCFMDMTPIVGLLGVFQAHGPSCPRPHGGRHQSQRRSVSESAVCTARATANLDRNRFRSSEASARMLEFYRAPRDFRAGCWSRAAIIDSHRMA